jgi:divalent metal cation (Fe/Co/Zn/Cd) transporter
MKKLSDKKVTYAALIGNSVTEVIKFIVAVIPGSAAMLAAYLLYVQLLLFF